MFPEIDATSLQSPYMTVLIVGLVFASLFELVAGGRFDTSLLQVPDPRAGR